MTDPADAAVRLAALRPAEARARVLAAFRRTLRAYGYPDDHPLSAAYVAGEFVPGSGDFLPPLGVVRQLLDGLVADGALVRAREPDWPGRYRLAPPSR